jgi:hypothetical protein
MPLLHRQALNTTRCDFSSAAARFKHDDARFLALAFVKRRRPAEGFKRKSYRDTGIRPTGVDRYLSGRAIGGGDLNRGGLPTVRSPPERLLPNSAAQDPPFRFPPLLRHSSLPCHDRLRWAQSKRGDKITAFRTPAENISSPFQCLARFLRSRARRFYPPPRKPAYACRQFLPWEHRSRR